MPRPWPLAMTGTCSCSAAWRAADSAPSIQTSEPSTRTGRSATASSPAIWLIARGVRPWPRRRGRGGQLGLGLVVQRLERNVKEHRPAVRCGRQPECLVHRGRYLRRRVLGPGPLGDRGQQRRMVDLLQAARAPAVVGGPAAQHDDRRAVEVRRHDRADAVGHTGACRHHRQARGPGQPGRRFRGEHRRLLVPDVDQREWGIRVHCRVVQREDVPAGQREHGRDAVPPCRLDRQSSPRARPGSGGTVRHRSRGDVTSELTDGGRAGACSRRGRGGRTAEGPDAGPLRAGPGR